MVTKKQKGLGRGLEVLLGPKVDDSIEAANALTTATSPGLPASLLLDDLVPGQREDLNPLEEAQGLQRLVKEFGLTHELAAQAVGRSRSAASNLLRLLNLADPVQTMLMAGDIDMGHARALLALDRATQITGARGRKPGQETGYRICAETRQSQP